MFDYLAYKNTIPVSLFSVGELPSLNPVSKQYRDFWDEQIRFCIDGKWVEYEGDYRWISGPCYFYVNFWHIMRNDGKGKSKTKGKSKPLLRDLEWIKSYVYATVRGFSGFEGDDAYTCHRILESPLDINLRLEELADDEEKSHTLASIYSLSGELKTYKPALEYLYEYKERDLGKPLFYNQALNLVDVESRGGGKSYTGSGMLVGHNFLFDGAMDYDEWREKIKEKKPLFSETLIGAIGTNYTKDLISKVKFGLENLEGGFIFNGVSYPAPLSKKYTDDWSSGSSVEQKYRKKIGGQWIDFGSRSKIHHRTFKDNAFAANGTRAGINILDEAGFMYNLEEVLGQMAECTADGADKFGTIWITGTGGDMDGGATESLKAVFYDPVANSCLAFDDMFENTGRKIGFFIPAWMTLNQYKDALGNTNKERALGFLMKVRETKNAGKSKKPLHDELQQRPIYPSEAFLLSEGNIFPSAELKAHLNWLEASTDGDIIGQSGELVVQSDGTLSWEPFMDKRRRYIDYPAKEDDDLEGCIQIWEHPEEGTAYGFYVGGCDPINQEKGPNTASLGSMFILRRGMPGNGGIDKVVAEYSGRPEVTSNFNENCRKLIAYYKGQLLWENNLPGLRTHFERHHSLQYLAYTPSVLKANASTSVNRVYGQHMTKPVREELELAVRDWLVESTGDGRLNLHQICSVPLIKELIAYNDHGNFDRVDAFLYTICQKMQMHAVIAKKREELKKIASSPADLPAATINHSWILPTTQTTRTCQNRKSLTR